MPRSQARIWFELVLVGDASYLCAPLVSATDFSMRIAIACLSGDAHSANMPSVLILSARVVAQRTTVYGSESDSAAALCPTVSDASRAPGM